MILKAKWLNEKGKEIDVTIVQIMVLEHLPASVIFIRDDLSTPGLIDEASRGQFRDVKIVAEGFYQPFQGYIQPFKVGE